MHSGIARQLSDMDGYNIGRSSGKAGEDGGNGDGIVKWSDEDEEHEQRQGDSIAEKEKESEMMEESEARIDEEEREKWSAVVHTQAGYAFVVMRWKRTEEVTRGDINKARVEEEVVEASMSTGNQEHGTVRKVVPFSKQPARENPITNTTWNTPKAPKVP